MDPQSVRRRRGRSFPGNPRRSPDRRESSAVLEAVQKVLSVGAPLALLWLGVASVLDGTISLGTALAANTVALSVLSPVQTMAAAGQMYITRIR